LAQGAAAQLTKHKRFQRSFKLPKGDVWFPKLFRLRKPDITTIAHFTVGNSLLLVIGRVSYLIYVSM